MGRKLRVDEKLKLSNENFKDNIVKFYEENGLSKIIQLKETPPYPTPHVLAQFANMTYKDYEHEEPKPPDGWELLTTASHFGHKNGYFGTAYWHQKYQQVVIAHQGTKNFGDLLTDVEGILRNKYVPQMSSASTFANKVVEVLQEIDKDMNVDFELFFTGHSLGGWLAQITTFTTEYLEKKGDIFLKKLHAQEHGAHANNIVQESRDVQEGWLSQITKTFQRKTGTFLKETERGEHKLLERSTVQDSFDVRQSYHPHTVVFDSPGCEKMLLKMKRNHGLRHIRRSIDLQHLDITSYLSAPNRINTCNSHVGTVYRIFPDFSMNFIQQNTLLYNLATHNMDKIEEAFDPKTGQVRKDGRGRPQIQEVVDWPLSARLKAGAELNDFFKWAEKLNNYHPEVMDTVPLHYQTEAYDECTNSLSIFNNDQREFLEGYLCLLQLKNTFQFENFLSPMSNDKDQNEVEKKLQNFQLDNERIRCSDTSTLHALIPYVKRLVRLFPHIKKKLKEQWSSSQIINRVCQEETKRYVKRTHQSTLDFTDGALGLKDFLTTDQKIWQLRMTDGDVWRGINEVYWVLQKPSCTPTCFNECNYTILELQWLLAVNRVIKLNEQLKSMKTPHLLMIAFGTDQPVNDELRDMFKKLFNSVKEKKGMKIFLTAQTEDSITDCIQKIAKETLGEGFIPENEELTWSDLTASSQTKMLEKTVNFYGRKVALNELTSAKSMTDLFPLSDLLHEKEVKIGEDPVPSAGSGYNEKYYIDRTFKHNNFIRQDIISDEGKGEFCDLLARTEQEFRELCHQNPASNVHRLEKDRSGEPVWQQSKGDLKTLRKYIDSHKFQSYAPSDLNELLELAKQQRVMLITDKAGMGKTTVLTYLYKRIKEKYKAHWLVIIDLKDYTEILKVQKEKMDKQRVLEFLSKEVLKLASHLEKELFKKSFEGNEISKVVVMVDGFDEISPKYKETVIEMLQVLKQTSLEQLWVTTRPHLNEELEDNLQQLSYTLQPFSEDEQVEFLKKFWLQNINLDSTDHDRLQIYAKQLISKLAQSISDKDKQFTGIPLQTRMLAEAFEEKFISFYRSDSTQPELPDKLDLLGLYEQFIERKYEIYNGEIPASGMRLAEQRERDFECMKLEHEKLALEELFTEDDVTLLQVEFHSIFSAEGLARIGIVQRNSAGKLQFIHRTFADYYVAEFLIKQLTNKTKKRTHVLDFLLSNVLLRTDCQVIRAFLDGLLGNFPPSKEVLKECGEKLDEQWNKREENGSFTTALHVAAKEDHVHINGFVKDSLESEKRIFTTTKMLLAKDRWEQTALHKAAENDSIEALNTIWELAGKVIAWQDEAERGHSEGSDTNHASFEENVLQHNQLKNKLFVSKDQYGNTAWHGAAQRGSLKTLEALWSWTKEAGLNKDELLLTQTGDVLTALHMAAQVNHVEILQKMWDWAGEVEMNPNDLKKKLLLAKDKDEKTAWHRAAESGTLEALNTLWSWAKEAQLEPGELLLASGKDGNNAWQLATERGHFEILKELWVWAKEKHLNQNDLKHKLLLATDKYGCTAWHRAAETGCLESLDILWCWAKEVELHEEELKNKFLLAKDQQEKTAWHLAAERNHFKLFEKMWNCAKEAQKNPDDLKKELLLAKDKSGYTVWHRAAQRGGSESLGTLWGWTKSATKPI